MTVLYASTETVAIAWLSTLPGLSAAMVGEVLPSDTTSWAASGFVTITGGMGTVDVDVPVNHSVLMVQCWANSPSASTVPWGKARNIAETIRVACQSPQSYGQLVHPAYSDTSACVLSAYLETDPRRSYGDYGDYAVMTFDLRLHWAASTR